VEVFWQLSSTGAYEEARAVALGDAATSIVVGRCPEQGHQVAAVLLLRSCGYPAAGEDDVG
jgi:hypothetical protein